MRKSNGEDDSNGNRFDNMAESFTVVIALSLVEAFGNKVCFIALYGAINILFDTKDPPIPNGSSVMRQLSQGLGVFFLSA